MNTTDAIDTGADTALAASELMAALAYNDYLRETAPIEVTDMGPLDNSFLEDDTAADTTDDVTGVPVSVVFSGETWQGIVVVDSGNTVTVAEYNANGSLRGTAIVPLSYCSPR